MDEQRGAGSFSEAKPEIQIRLEPEVREWEPAGALVPGPTGLEAYERIVAEVRDWLTPRGSLVLEIGATQAVGVRELALDAGFAVVEVRQDLVGRDRVVVARA